MNPDAESPPAERSIWSRRYICQHCGRKGRVSPARRGPQVKCPACKQETPARLLTETLALNAARHGVPLNEQPPPPPLAANPRYVAHRKRMLHVARGLTEDQVDCVAYALQGERVTDSDDTRWRRADIVQWHADALAQISTPQTTTMTTDTPPPEPPSSVADEINQHLSHFAVYSDVTINPDKWRAFVRLVRGLVESNDTLRKVCDAEGSAKERANEQIASLRATIDAAHAELDATGAAGIRDVNHRGLADRIAALVDEIAKARARAGEKCAIAADLLETSAKITGENATLRAEVQRLNGEIKRRDQINEALRVHETLGQPVAEVRYTDAFHEAFPETAICSTLSHAMRVACEVGKALRAERDELKRALGNMREHRFMDVTPDAGLPARILQAYIEDGETVSEPPELAAMMNGWQSERNAILRAALARLASGPQDLATAYREKAAHYAREIAKEVEE